MCVQCEQSNFLQEHEEVQEQSLHYEERITELHSVIAELNEKIGLLQCTIIRSAIIKGMLQHFSTCFLSTTLVACLQLPLKKG